MTGGNVYIQEMLRAISSEKNYFETETIDLSPKRFKTSKFLKAIEIFFNLLKFRGEKDLWIRNFYSIVFFSKKRTKGKNIAMIFHVDFSGFPLLLKPFLIFFEKFVFYHQLRKADVIVVVGEYYKNHFLERGYPNVKKVYFGFDLKEFNVTEKEVIGFKEKYNLKDKPIVYLGNCQKAKGALDSYNVLKGLDVHFVTSGKKEFEMPALNLNLTRREYLILLKASSIAITMSKFKEGWCWITHEAMLSKTPVIGSGKAGMREPLEGGQQIICEDFSKLREKVEFLLKNPEKRRIMGEKGYNFAKDFTKERFKKSWLDLINKILN